MKRRKFNAFNGDDEDPLSVVVNLFDVAMVFAVSLMVGIVLNMNMADFFSEESFTIVKNPGKANMEIITKEGKEVNSYRASGETQSADGTKGRRLGTAYELENGEIIYVPE